MDVSQFTESIQKDLAHRKQELSRILLMVQDADPDPSRLSCLSRSAVALSYAHWEGFIKTSSIKYLGLINSQNIAVSSLKLSLQATHLASHFKRASASSKMRFIGEVLAQMDHDRTEMFRVNPLKCIDTESNLSSTVFQELVLGLGLDYLDAYSTRQVFIDRQVLYSRNQVVHGELVTFDFPEVDSRTKGVIQLMDLYSDQLIDAASSMSFMLGAS